LANDYIDTASRPSVYFYHIPKTGGMSLRAFLADQYSEREHCRAIEWLELARMSRDQIAEYRLFYGHFSANLSEILPPGVKTFTFLRDPVERTISTTRHALRDPRFHPMHEAIRGASLKAVIYNDTFMETLRNSQTALLSFDIPPQEIFDFALRREAEDRPFELGQLRWTSSPAKALAALDSFAYVGLMERFDDSLLGLCQVFNYVPPEIMPDLNRASDTIDYKRELDARDIDHIESLLADDMQVYAAAKDKFRADLSRQDIIARLMAEKVLRPIAAPCAIDLGHPFAGSGWYGPERQNGAFVRWSGPDPKAQIYLPIDRSEARVVNLRLWRRVRLDELDATIEGEDVSRKKFSDGGCLSVAIELPALPEGGLKLTTVVVDSQSVSTASERNDKDLRTLGVMLTYLAVT
jgi:hypothetical protein